MVFMKKLLLSTDLSWTDLDGPVQNQWLGHMEYTVEYES